MNNKTIAVVIVAVLLLVGTLIYFLDALPSWAETYDKDSDDAFAASLLFETLEASSALEVLSDSLSFTDQHGTAICLKRQISFNQLDLDKLISHVEAGNEVVLIAEGFGVLLNNYLGLDELEFDPMSNSLAKATIQSDYLSKVSLFRENKDTLALVSVTAGQKLPRSWFYFDKERLKESSSDFVAKEWIGVDEEQISALSYAMGEGELHLLLNPIVFTNYYFKEEKTFAYFEKLLAPKPNQKTVWIDTPNAIIVESDLSEGPLSYLLATPALRQAWYLCIVGLILFLLFGARRTRGIIPIWRPKENTSLAFASQIARLYNSEEDQAELLKIEIRWFLQTFRERYKTPFSSSEWQDKDNHDHLRKLTGASQTEIEDVQSIMALNRRYMLPKEELYAALSVLSKFRTKHF